MRTDHDRETFASMGIELGEVSAPEIVAASEPPGSGGQPQPPPPPPPSNEEPVKP